MIHFQFLFQNRSHKQPNNRMKALNEFYIDVATLFAILIAGALRWDEALMEANEGK